MISNRDNHNKISINSLQLGISTIRQKLSNLEEDLAKANAEGAEATREKEEATAEEEQARRTATKIKFLISNLSTDLDSIRANRRALIEELTATTTQLNILVNQSTERTRTAAQLGNRLSRLRAERVSLAKSYFDGLTGDRGES